MSPFEAAPSSNWILAASVPSGRRDWLLSGQSYERITAELLATTSEVAFHQQAEPEGRGSRCIVTIHVEPKHLDRFFSASTGYRAQYFVCPDQAHEADSHVIEAALPLLLRSLPANSSRAPNRGLLEASLSHPWAKVWPYQGLWLRRSKLEERVLLVPQWQQQLSAQSAQRRKLARWGSLAPQMESRLQLKGGYVQGGYHMLLGKPQPTRGREIHELGFT